VEASCGVASWAVSSWAEGASGAQERAQGLQGWQGAAVSALEQVSGLDWSLLAVKIVETDFAGGEGGLLVYHVAR
jgi:hypothetical protein